ncbi:MAG: hypothetical protein O9253_00610 [Aquidulcibacter sp.]|nr:hypothetical protein [Aquidulcibacter sp.]
MLPSYWTISFGQAGPWEDGAAFMGQYSLQDAPLISVFLTAL